MKPCPSRVRTRNLSTRGDAGSVERMGSSLNPPVGCSKADRPHGSINNLTPDEAHTGTMKVQRLWKNDRPKRSTDNPVQDVRPTMCLSLVSGESWPNTGCDPPDVGSQPRHGIPFNML